MHEYELRHEIRSKLTSKYASNLMPYGVNTNAIKRVSINILMIINSQMVVHLYASAMQYASIIYNSWLCFIENG
jgi:hypothetical protein